MQPARTRLPYEVEGEIPPAPVPDAPVASRFVGKVALITGAARGQGRAEALRFAAEGADVILLDNCATSPTTSYPGPTLDDLLAVCREVEALDRRAVAHQVDTRDLDGLVAAVADGYDRLGRLDVVVANAGMTSANVSWKITAEQWDETIGANLTGAFNTAKATIPLLLEQERGGSIVFIGSVAGQRGLPFLGDYVAAKHGVVGLMKVFANELDHYRIRVNIVHPWGVDTGLKVHEMHGLIEEYPAFGSMFGSAWPDQISEADDIAAAVAWISSDEARHVTGVELPVDRGRTNR
jgi:SDR family mycofactocin-dependent oxidoreductase